MTCPKCYGKGKLPTTGSARFFPERFPNEHIPCTLCKGSGEIVTEEQINGNVCPNGQCS